MPILKRDEILNKDDREKKEIEVPEWGGSVIVQALSAAERDSWETGDVVKDDFGNYTNNTVNVRARLVAKCCVNEAGERIFSDADVELLGKKAGAVVDRLFWVARRLSKLSNKDIEDLEKNAGSGQPA